MTTDNLFFLNSMSGGGAERVTANLANHWASNGNQVTIVTLSPTGQDAYPLDPAIKRIGLNLANESHSLLTAVSSNIKRVRALRRCLRQVRPDVAIGIMSTASCLLGLAGASACKLRIGTEHIHPPQLPLGRVWERIRTLAYGRLDLVIALTAESADWIRENTHARKVAVIPNAVSLPLGSGEPKRNPQDYLQADRKNILAVGRLNEQKGFERLLHAFAQVADDFPLWNVAVLGDGPLRRDLQDLATTLGIGHRITMPGHTGNMGDWYKATDLYVMTSRFEGFPMVLVEAMAHGLPVVSVDCDTGPRDVIRHGKDGLLVPQDDPEALIAALREMMSDDTKRQAFAREAVNVRDRFSMPKISENWQALIGEALGDHQPGADGRPEGKTIGGAGHS